MAQSRMEVEDSASKRRRMNVETIRVHFSSKPGKMVTEVNKAYAFKVCSYLEAQWNFNQAAKIETDPKIVGLANPVASAFRSYLKFDSKDLMQLPREDLKNLANYYGLVEVENELKKEDDNEEFLSKQKIPFLTTLRDSQNYVRAADRGLGIFELGPAASAMDREQWQPILKWLKSKRSQV